MSEYLENEHLSTSEQAKDLFNWIEDIVNSHSIKYSWVNDGFGSIDLEKVPNSVAAHFPSPDPLCKKVNYKLYVSREKNWMTSNPKIVGWLGEFMFMQSEIIDKDLRYESYIKYGVISTDGHLSLERHLHHSEEGPHVAIQRQVEWDRPIFERLISDIQETTDSLRRLHESRPIEIASGILDVTHKEAQDIIDLCESLN